jgi:hypothetical protein
MLMLGGERRTLAVLVECHDVAELISRIELKKDGEEAVHGHTQPRCC